MEDINGLEPTELREHMQGDVLEQYLTDTGTDPADVLDREWSDEEGIFVIRETATGEIVALAYIIEVEDA